MRIGKYYCKNMKYRINIYISREISIEHPSVGFTSLAQLIELFQVDGSARPKLLPETAIFISGKEF